MILKCPVKGKDDERLGTGKNIASCGKEVIGRIEIHKENNQETNIQS